MSWVFFALGAYFLSALSQTFDKALLKSRIPSAGTYAFYSGITSVFAVIVLPFVPTWSDMVLGTQTLLFAFAAGICFVVALYLLYVSLRRCDVSRIAPIIGATIPIFLIIFSFMHGDTLVSTQIIAIVFFIAGGFVLATEVQEQNSTLDTFFSHFFGMPGKRLALCSYEPRKGIVAAIFAALFFAATFYLSKIVYEAPSYFIPEFFWMRIGSVLAALFMLAMPFLRKDIFAVTPSVSRGSLGMFFGNKTVGAGSFFLLNVAFNAAPSQAYVVLINALKGTEHLFIFIFTIVLTLFVPHILEENFDRHTLVIKSLGIVLIGTGFWYLV